MALSFLYVLASLKILVVVIVVWNTKIVEGIFFLIFKIAQMYNNILFFYQDAAYSMHWILREICNWRINCAIPSFILDTKV